MDERSFEDRQHGTTDAALVVSYRIEGDTTGYDLSQSKSVSNGGMLLTTNVAFERGTQLDLTVRLPMLPNAIECTREVIGSRELAKDQAYDTRLRFIEKEPGACEAVRHLLEGLLRQG